MIFVNKYPISAAHTGALLRCSSLMWLATPRSSLLVLHVEAACITLIPIRMKVTL